MAGVGKTLRIVPTLIFPYILYHIFAWTAGKENENGIDVVMGEITLASGQPWTLTLGHFVIVLALIFLYVEIFKSTRTSNDSPILDHMASLGLFVICMVEFMMAKVAGTSTFFIILMMTLVDVIGGFTISFTGARRDFGGGG